MIKALLDFLRSLWPFSGGVQGDDAPGGWKEPVYDDEQSDDPGKS